MLLLISKRAEGNRKVKLYFGLTCVEPELNSLPDKLFTQWDVEFNLRYEILALQ